MLVWRGARRASYYNVQLFHGRTKVLTDWPRRPRLQLHQRWRFRGRRMTLTPGHYRWYIWPGFGRRSEVRYGRVLGGSSFVVVR